MDKLEYYSLKMVRFFARGGLALAILMLGLDSIGDEGERNYNKYMHSLRKMKLPNTKPSDASFVPGLSWNDMNKTLITANGVLLCLAAACIVLNQFQLAGIFISTFAIFMAGTKDNYYLKSDVSAINREKKDRLEWLSSDLSLLGVGLALLGGIGQHDPEPVLPVKKSKKRRTEDEDE